MSENNPSDLTAKIIAMINELKPLEMLTDNQKPHVEELKVQLSRLTSGAHGPGSIKAPESTNPHKIERPPRIGKDFF